MLARLHIFMCYTLAVESKARRNITISLPPELIRSAKVLASRQGTSISHMVRQSLEEVVVKEDRHERALDLILSGARASKRRSAAKWRRQDLYE